MDNKKLSNFLPQFSLSIMKTKEGGTLKELKPDAKGVFHGVPVFVFNQASRNNVFYEPESVVSTMTNGAMKFKKSIDEGTLRGEYGHPDIEGATDEDKRRLLKIDEKFVSHAFISMVPDRTPDGDILLRADFTPFGPYGDTFLSDMLNPNVNKCFSLRALCAKPEIIGGVTHKKVLIMVTFDYVGMPGFEKASTRFAVGSTESMDYYITPTALAKMGEVCDLVGVESLTTQSLLDILHTDQLTIEHTVKGFVNRDKGVIITPTGELPLFKTLFEQKG